MLKFPLDRLYALPEGGQLYQSLGFSPGFAKVRLSWQGSSWSGLVPS